ncbi:MAG: type II toxin-antitoxin system VapC family toxin [Thermoanaerobacteraceae bacterium]|nr:type II toxin-antitoxin system VapC family toxin [Thermoanaerobacteraceae bacterium]
MAERVVIDTTVLIAHLRSKSRAETVFERVVNRYSKCLISAVTAWEIEYGAVRAGRNSDLDYILPLVEVMPFGLPEARVAAKIYAGLVSRNQVIEMRDVFIAATCLANDLPLVTENRGHFQRIEGLTLGEP